MLDNFLNSLASSAGYAVIPVIIVGLCYWYYRRRKRRVIERAVVVVESAANAAVAAATHVQTKAPEIARSTVETTQNAVQSGRRIAGGLMERIGKAKPE